MKYKKKNNDNGDNGDDDKGELYNDWHELERQIKDFKEGANNSKIERNEKYPINMSLFQDL